MSHEASGGGKDKLAQKKFLEAAICPMGKNAGTEFDFRVLYATSHKYENTPPGRPRP
jgi:hypothetical protein